MTYTPPPYSGSNGNPSWSASPPAAGWPTSQGAPGLPPPGNAPGRQRTLVVSVILAVGLVATAALWLVTFSRNNDMLANNEQLIARVDDLQTERDSLATRNAGLRSDIDDARSQVAGCVAALDAAENTVELLAEVLDLSGDAIEAASNWNANRLESINDDLDALTPQIEKSVTDYRSAATDCRSGS